MQRQCLAEAQPTRSPSIELAASGGVAIDDLHLHFRPGIQHLFSQPVSSRPRTSGRQTEEAMRECGWMELQRQQRRSGRKAETVVPCASQGWISDFCPLQSRRLLPLVQQGVGGMRSGQAGPCWTPHPCKKRSNPQIAGAGHSEIARNSPPLKLSMSVNCRLMSGIQASHRLVCL